MRTTLELPDPLFARLKSRAASERVTLKQLLQSFVEQGLSTAPPESPIPRSAATLPRLEGPLAMASEQLSNASLFELLEP
ncbi:hypothetical protein [Synechococcus sp. 1G10]|uniref:hypothetical protein n=1 Tax=Synechococcus sp. 1G10 TaxID=2025605 RepID=UPI000B991F07|nr:hypothetical protein [Synechococcus sp. 1G10]